MQMHKILAMAGVVLSLALPAHAAEPPPIPEKPDPKSYEDIPAPWRDYLLQARAAERIADPLRRCLAFPDLPGNRWPQGHAEAHCRNHFDNRPPLLAEIAALVDGGDLARLEALMDASQQRHFDERAPTEDIHEIFNYQLFEPSAESDRVTAKWLQLAPQSAYAQLARGSFLSRSAWAARGDQYAAETPRQNMRRMSELVEQAIPFLEKAISLNPRLMPAYTELHELAMADSRADLEASAFERAQKVDPTCVELANVHMRALLPRWGGDYEQMLSYANQLSRHVARRPQLAMHMATPYGDRGQVLADDNDQYTSSTLTLLETAVAIGSNEDALNWAGVVANGTTDVKPDKWKSLGYLLQESRFREGDAWNHRNIAWRLVDREPEWSLRYSLRAIELNPNSGFGHYVAGAGYYNVGKYVEADREYAIAIEDPSQRHASLREVAAMWLLNAGLKDKEAAAKAKPYIEQLLREYPEDGRGWIMQFHRETMLAGLTNLKSIRAVLEKADRSDPWQARHAQWIEELLTKVKTDNAKPKSEEE